MIPNLDDYLQKWSLREPKLMTQSPRGDVYTAYQNDEQVVLKLLTPIGAEDEADGAVAMHYFDGRGAVWLLAYDERAHLMEYAGGNELAELVTSGHDLRAAEIIADVLNLLHRSQPDVAIPKLRTVRQRFESLFARATQDQVAGNNSIYVRGARVAEQLLANPQDECVLHGDIQHHNIRLHSERGWLAYDAKGLYGERLFDVTNAVCNPSTARKLVMSEDRLLQVSQVIADKMGADVGRLRAFVFAYACLSASWPDKPEGSEVQQWFLTVAQNAEQHVDL